MRIGVLVQLKTATDVDRKFSDVRAMDMCSCQLVVWDRALMTDTVAENIRSAAGKHGVDITAFWCGWQGPKVWDFYDGQLTLGLVPAAYRFKRMEMLLEGSDFAQKIGVRDVVTHAGYLPENPYDPSYQEVLSALKVVAGKCRENGQRFLFETGQETPVTLKRAIADIGLDNLGVNLDPANLIMYGKANPVDALDVLGEYVMGVHGKDALYPTDGRKLGVETPLGKGKVNFPRLIARLKEVGYDGDITIEREISGEDQKRDILLARELLKQLI